MSQATDGNSQPTFGLAEAMILTAATAVAVSLLRVILKQHLSSFSDVQPKYYLSFAVTVGSTFAAFWGIALLAIELRSSQLRSKSWKSRPGLVACATATAGTLIKLLALLVWAASHDAFIYLNPTVMLGRHIIEPAAMSVVAAWLTLWLVGSLRPARTWSDSLGIIVGIAWIVLYGMFWFSMT